MCVGFVACDVGVGVVVCNVSDVWVAVIVIVVFAEIIQVERSIVYKFGFTKIDAIVEIRKEEYVRGGDDPP